MNMPDATNEAPRGGVQPIADTERLVTTRQVEGAAIYNRDGDRIGTIAALMVDKRTGRIEYIVMASGGFLGMGESLHPLPWAILAYDSRRGGYVVDLDQDMLKGGPSYRASDEPAYDAAYAERVSSYYGVPWARTPL